MNDIPELRFKNAALHMEQNESAMATFTPQKWVHTQVRSFFPPEEPVVTHLPDHWTGLMID